MSNEETNENKIKIDYCMVVYGHLGLLFTDMWIHDDQNVKLLSTILLS